MCHSLGGLIVCQVSIDDAAPYQVDFQQAVLLALQTNNVNYGAFNYKGFNTIRGIIFFGTPFRGSSLAGWATFAAKWLMLRLFIDTTTLNYLTIDNTCVKKIVQKFAKWVKQNDVQLITFYERKKLTLGLRLFRREVG